MNDTAQKRSEMIIVTSDEIPLMMPFLLTHQSR